MAVLTADQLIDLLPLLVELCLLVGIAAVMLGNLFHSAARAVARWFEKRGNPPSPAMKLLVAKNLRKRAATLEIQAEKALQK